MATANRQQYKPTEAKYKGGADEMYVTYDLPQETRGGSQALYPKVKRVYIAGKVKDWKVGNFTKRSGRRVHGVKIDYEQSRDRYKRSGYTARRGSTQVEVSPVRVGPGKSSFTQIVEVPKQAQNVRFHQRGLPRKYQQARQAVR
jgi:hypothetical protein